jgi:hypothetical protein
MMNTMFSPWIAIAFPVTCGLTGYFEIPMFWVEHYLAALVNPLVLSLSGRYYTKSTICLKNHIFAHCIFSLWQRIMLFPLSQLSHANLNFTLCPSIKDPFLPFLDHWYYIVSDYYIFFGGEIFHRLIKMVIKILLNVKSFFVKEVDDDNSNKIN